MISCIRDIGAYDMVYLRWGDRVLGFHPISTSGLPVADCSTWIPTAEKCKAMQRSKLDLGGYEDTDSADISMSSDSSCTDSLSISSYSFASTIMIQSTDNFAADPDTITLANNSSLTCSTLTSATASRSSSALGGRKRLHPLLHALPLTRRSTIAYDVQTDADCRCQPLLITMLSWRLPRRKTISAKCFTTKWRVT